MITSSPQRPRILADIGGTNARFAWQDSPGAPLQHVLVLQCAEYASLESALREYLHRIHRPMPLDASLAMANPVLGDWIRMTNHHWAFSIAAMKSALELERLVIVNDFTAVALSLRSGSGGAIST